MTSTGSPPSCRKSGFTYTARTNPDLASGFLFETLGAFSGAAFTVFVFQPFQQRLDEGHNPTLIEPDYQPPYSFDQQRASTVDHSDMT